MNWTYGFKQETGTAVGILSNIPLDYKISATVLGVKLMKDLCR